MDKQVTISLSITESKLLRKVLTNADRKLEDKCILDDISGPELESVLKRLRVVRWVENELFLAELEAQRPSDEEFID